MPPTKVMMPSRMDRPSGTAFIGIDPGVEGGLVTISPMSSLRRKHVDAVKMPETDGDRWEWFKTGRSAVEFAVIEQQVPRPTMVFDPKTKQFKPTILKSTCLLYGNYMQLKGMLLAACIPFEDCPPKRWQEALKMRRKEKGEKKTDWKNYLKSVAQQLFPDVKVTLWSADALLMAEYAKRSREGTL